MYHQYTILRLSSWPIRLQPFLCGRKSISHDIIVTASSLPPGGKNHPMQVLIRGEFGSGMMSWEEQLGPTHPLIAAQKEDLRALAVVILEAVFSALAEGRPSAATSADALRRLLVDVFHCNIQQFRCFIIASLLHL